MRSRLNVSFIDEQPGYSIIRRRRIVTTRHDSTHIFATYVVYISAFQSDGKGRQPFDYQPFISNSASR